MTFRLLHMLALFWMLAGVGSVVVPIWRAWGTKDLDTRATLLSEAQRNEAGWLLPGLIATWFTGFGLATAADWNIVTTGWLLTKEIIFAVDTFIILPLMGVGLRRVRYLALQAQKQGAMTEELQDALHDNVPVVFGTILAVTLPLVAFFAVVKPF